MISVGDHIGRYKVLNSIGVGGMGEVFLAVDIELERFVALKVLPSDVSNDKERIRRFVQEAKAASALNHPNILTIHEIGLVNGTRFIASEFIKGKTLRDKIKSESLNLSETIEIAIQITSALHTAHSSQIIHRDIKPENIMIREDNLVKVLDFGLAKLTIQKPQLFNSESPTCEQEITKSGMIFGTVGYMSPEQARGITVDHRTDIFSLGVVLYEILTGKQPFPGDTNSDVIAAILMNEPQNPRLLNSVIPAELERIILKTLCKDCEGRYQNAKDLLEDFKELKQDLDFKSKTERKILANERTEAKTGIPKADTNKTINVLTDPIDELPTYKNPKNKANLVYKFRHSLPIILSLIVVGIFVYFILAAVWFVPPKNEAVKLFSYGTEALREGTYYKASKMFEDAVRIDNNFPDAHAGLAEAWMELDYFGRAQSEMLKVNEIQSKKQTFFSGLYKTEDSLYIDAINAIVIRNFPQAVKIYQKIAERNPTEPHVYLDLGRAYEKNEEIEKAIECYEKVVSLNGQYGAGFLRLGILLTRKTLYDKSNEAFDRAEIIYERLSNDEGVAEVKYQRGVSFNIQEKLDAAQTQFEQVIGNSRANKYQQIRAMLQISSVCSSLGKTPCAEEYASNAITLAKQERMENLASNGLINFGNAFLMRAEYGKAEQNFQKALEFSRKDDGLYNEARALLSMGSLRIQQKKPDQAEVFVRQALPFFQKGAYRKEVAQANLILGRANEMKENYDVALIAFAQVVNSEDASPAERAYAEMISGNLLMNKEKYPEALHHFEQSYDLYQSLNNPYYMAYSLLYHVDVLCQLGQFQDAKDKLLKVQEIIEQTPSYQTQFSPRVRLLNAQIALSQRNFTEAINEAKQAGNPTDSFAAFNLNKIVGLAQAISNLRSTEGVKNCNKALQFAISTKDLRTINIGKLSLAEAYMNTGKSSEALEIVLQAKDYFISAGQLESGWRTWLIAAQASQQKGDTKNAKDYALEALKILNQIQNDWGQEHFNIYLAKPDINFYYNQAEKLAKS